jgi:glycosyltransferase involved in cell wall biosynthesis
VAAVSGPLGISVAMATYNGEAFIREQLQSICAQTRLPAEIVVSDDGSSDRTLEIVREVLNSAWLKKHSVTLTVLTNSVNLGPGKNFEQAIYACSNEVIALADQDDVWHPEKLEILVGELESRPEVLLVHTNARLIDATGADMPITLFDGLEVSADEQSALVSGWSLPALVKRNLVTGATALFRRELAELAFSSPTIELHDGRLAIVASVLDGVLLVPQELIGYRQHGGNQIGGTRMSMLDRSVAVMKSWREMTDRLAILNTEHQALLDSLGDRVSVRNRDIMLGRIAHNQWRIGLPASRVLRVWPVIAGYLGGRYRDFGRVPHDVIRDLVMPPWELLLGFLRWMSGLRR